MIIQQGILRLKRVPEMTLSLHQIRQRISRLPCPIECWAAEQHSGIKMVRFICLLQAFTRLYPKKRPDTAQAEPI